MCKQLLCTLYELLLWISSLIKEIIGHSKSKIHNHTIKGFVNQTFRHIQYVNNSHIS